MMKRFFVSGRKNIKLSKISSDAGRAFLRLREDWKGVGQRLPGRVLDPFIPLVGLHLSRPHTFPRAKKHSSRSAYNLGLLEC